MSNRIKRSSNIELLRILAMLMIVASHWGWAIYDMPATDFTWINENFRWVFRSFGQVGVVIFVLITGYFSSTKRFNIKSLIRLFTEIFFMNVVVFALSLLFAHFTDAYIFDINRESFLNVFMLINNGYWFIKAYVFIALLSPFINIILSKINKRQFTALICMMFLLLSVMPTFLQLADDNIFAFFILLYLMGAYMRIYPECIKIKTSALVLMTVVCYSLFCLSTSWDKLADASAKFNVLLIITSLVTFALFSKFNIKCSKVINAIASTTFGIYIIHDGEYRFALWENILKCNENTQDVLFPLYSIGAVVLVFAVCSLISLAYKKGVEPIITKFIDTVFEKQISEVNSLFPDIKNEINQSDERSKNALPLIIQILITYLLSTLLLNGIYIYLGFLAANIIIFAVAKQIKKNAA